MIQPAGDYGSAACCRSIVRALTDQRFNEEGWNRGIELFVGEDTTEHGLKPVGLEGEVDSPENLTTNAIGRVMMRLPPYFVV